MACKCPRKKKKSGAAAAAGGAAPAAGGAAAGSKKGGARASRASAAPAAKQGASAGPAAKGGRRGRGGIGDIARAAGAAAMGMAQASLSNLRGFGDSGAGPGRLFPIHAPAGGKRRGPRAAKAPKAPAAKKAGPVIVRPLDGPGPIVPKHDPAERMAKMSVQDVPGVEMSRKVADSVGIMNHG